MLITRELYQQKHYRIDDILSGFENWLFLKNHRNESDIMS